MDHVDHRKISMLVFMLAMGNVADAIQITSISYIMSEIEDLTSYHKVWLSSSVFLGMLFGGILFGYMSDREGRRPCLLLALVINFLGGFAAVGAPSGSAGVEFLVMCYLFAGIGIGGTVPITFSLGVELFPTDKRGQYLALMASFWVLGNLYTALIGWILLGNDINGNKILATEEGGTWRVFIAVCAAPILMTIVMTYSYIPESPLYLLVRGRHAEVSAFVKQHTARYGPSNGTEDTGGSRTGAGAGGSGGSDAIIENPIQPMQVSSEIDLSVLASAGDASQSQSRSVGLRSSVARSAARYSTLEEVDIEIEAETETGAGAESGAGAGAGIEVSRGVAHTASFRRRVRPLHATRGQHQQQRYYSYVLLLSVIWFCLSFSTFGILLWVNTLFASMHLMNIYASTFLFALGSLPGGAFAFMYMEKFGRQRILTGSLLASMTAGLAFAGSASLQLGALERGAATDGQLVVNALIVVCSMLFGAFSVSSWNALDTLSAELFPATVRPTTMGLLAGAGRVGAIVSQIVCGYTLVITQHRIVELLLTVSLSVSVAFMCAVCLPDTTGVYLSDSYAEMEMTNLGHTAAVNAALGGSVTPAGASRAEAAHVNVNVSTVGFEQDDRRSSRGSNSYTNDYDDGEEEEENKKDIEDPISALSRSIKRLPAALAGAANMDIPLFVTPSPKSKHHQLSRGNSGLSSLVGLGSRRSDMSGASIDI